MDINELERLFPQVWVRETSAFPDLWSMGNPAFGQCFPTAWVARRYLGGRVVQGVLKPRAMIHFWNVLPDGQRIDFTESQFQGRVPPWHASQMLDITEELFCAYCSVFKGVGERYRLFRDRFDALLL